MADKPKRVMIFLDAERYAKLQEKAKASYRSTQQELQRIVDRALEAELREPDTIRMGADGTVETLPPPPPPSDAG